MSDQNPLIAWLGGFTGNLQVLSQEDEKNKNELVQFLKSSIPSSIEFSQAKNSPFVFEKLIPSTLKNLTPELQQQISDVVSDENIALLQKEFKVFQRETPVRNVNALRSTPLWAAGAAVAKTIGPFINIDGKRVWFDFFSVEKLVALYIQGAANPAIIFNVNVAKTWTGENTALLAPDTQTYKLTANSSMWINSEILAPDAPAGKYTGLTISSGTIDLSTMPVINGDKTIVSLGTLVTVKLKLAQQKVTDADDTSPYGADARAAEYTLPDVLEFQFNNSGSTITNISGAKWKIFDQPSSFKWNNTKGNYNADLFSLFIPFNSSEANFTINKSLSPFAQFSGTSKIIASYWNLPAADLDLAHISPAAGIGALAILCDKGISTSWTGLQNEDISINSCFIIAHPEGIAIGTTAAGNLYSKQNFSLWKDEKNPHESKLKIDFGKQFPLRFFSTVIGYEIIEATVNIIVEADRPIDVSAKPLPVRTKGSLLALFAYKNHRTIILYDNNLIQDNLTADIKSFLDLPVTSIALRNALFTTSAVMGCFLTGDVSPDWKKVESGNLYLSLGIYKYIPMLPDPYAANVSVFQQFKDYRVTDKVQLHIPVMLLLCQVKWGVRGEDLPDHVTTGFHLLPFSTDQNNEQLITLPAAPDTQNNVAAFNNDLSNAMVASNNQINDWSKAIDNYFRDLFALLDVSSHANQMGVSFGQLTGERGPDLLFREFGVETQNEQMQSLYSVPFKIEEVQVMSPGIFVRSFTLPQIAWEPVHNLTEAHIAGDPPKGMNFYPDDGGPSRFFNTSLQYVPLAPKPVIKDIIRRYKEEKDNVTISYFTLPFGLKALTLMSKHKQAPQPPTVEINQPIFNNDFHGGIQMQVHAGKLSSDDFPLFNGATIQLTNVLDAGGNITNAGTLGQSVATIFNGEFKPKTPLITSRGVPLTRIDFSGYGANIFSNWFNPNAEIAQTSQTKFDVFTGRTAHEVIQVRSLVYPWGIHVVRTIVLYRNNTGYVYRVDTGWQAESDGKFNFTYHIKKPDDDFTTPFPAHFKIHPGAIKGLFNIKNIVEINTPPFPTSTAIKNNDWYLDDNNNAIQNTTGSDISKPAVLQKITFDADVEIEGAIQGQVNGRVPSKQVIGYVQLAPMGVPISAAAFTALIESENGSIGGDVNCMIDIHNSKQRMRINHFDVSNETKFNSNEVFVAAARGSVVLPKDGAWSMITHEASSGEVSPLPENITVPLIRIGELVMNGSGDVTLNADPNTQLLRIANPTEILRAPAANTINYGLLQNTGTQKTLFLTPSFKHNIEQLMSRTPPLFADAYRIMRTKSIFPNIGDAVTSFGDAVDLKTSHFTNSGSQDAGLPVFQLMNIANNVADAAGNLQDQALKLLNKAGDFDLPAGPIKLVDEDFLKLYIEYKTTPHDKQGNPGPTTNGKLNFDIDSLANKTADKWKSRLNNLAMVVDLGPFERLMLIKGNFDSKKGAESNYEGSDTDPSLPSAEIEFSPALQTVIEILQILQDLSGGEYKDALKKGLKIAMSNNAGTWEYKFEATKEIPVVKFPLGILYNDPEQPLKLEASLKVGVYFNGALMITTDAKKLLPTVGAYLGFYGQVTVMCVSLAAASVYAVGQVTLDIAADTAKGPSLHMKFGFGAQLVVGLPVVGNVSVLYMVGVEIYTDKDVVEVSAFLLFKGHAELLGGIVGITITIEAKGTVKRIESEKRTDCRAQVTFAIDISIFLVIDINFSKSWEEQRQIA